MISIFRKYFLFSTGIVPFRPSTLYLPFSFCEITRTWNTFIYALLILTCEYSSYCHQDIYFLSPFIANLVSNVVLLLFFNFEHCFLFFLQETLKCVPSQKVTFATDWKSSLWKTVSWRHRDFVGDSVDSWSVRWSKMAFINSIILKIEIYYVIK